MCTSMSAKLGQIYILSDIYHIIRLLLSRFQPKLSAKFILSTRNALM